MAWWWTATADAQLFWDANGATSGSGNVGGSWNSGANWTTDSTGALAAIGWSDGNQAVFSAGNDGTGTLAITITGTANPLGVAVEEGTVNVTGGTLNLGGNVIDISAGALLNVGSVVSGSGGFTKNGSGTLILSSAPANTYTGTILLNGGTLGVAGGTGDGTIRGNVTVAAGATLRLDVSNRIINSSLITLNSRGTLDRNGLSDVVGALAGDGVVSGAGTLTLDLITGMTTTFSGSITGGGIEIRGYNVNGTSAKQVFTGTINTAGVIAVRRGNSEFDAVVADFAGFGSTTAGTLAVGLTDVGGTLGTATVNVLDSHTLTLQNISVGDQNGHSGVINQSGGAVTVSNLFRVGHYPNESSGYNLSGGVLSLSGTPTGIVNQSGVGEQNGIIYLGVDGTGAFTQSGGLASAHGVVLDARGNTAGVDTLTLSAGTLTLGASGIKSGSLDANTSYQITLGGSGGVLGASAAWNSALHVTLAGTGASAITFDTGANSIGLSGVLSGAGGLQKTGNGTLRLAGANSFAGNVAVTAGTVLVNGDQSAATGTVSVAANATLGGRGVVGGSVMLASNAVLAPGDPLVNGGVGLLTINDTLDWNSGTLAVHLHRSTNSLSDRGLNYDALDIANLEEFGAITVTEDFLASAYVPTAGDQFDLLNWSTLGATPGTPTFNLPDMSSFGLSWDTSAFTTTGVIALAVPEPSVWALFSLAVAAALGRWLARRSRAAGSVRT